MPLYSKQMPTFPLEITYMILDLLVNDVQSLRSISLVCKTWHKISDPHLFRSIDLRPRAAQLRFYDIFKDSDNAVRIAPYVRVLSIGYARYGRLEALAALLKLFTNVQILNISLIKVDGTRESARELLEHAFPRVTEMCLDTVVFKDYEQFFTLINARPLLKKLSIRNVDIGGSMDWPDADPLTLPPGQLSTLVLAGSNMLGSCWIITALHQTLRSVTIRELCNENVPLINGMLVACEMLEELTFEHCLGSLGASTVLDLEFCENLKVVRFLLDQSFVIESRTTGPPGKAVQCPSRSEGCSGKLGVNFCANPRLNVDTVNVKFSSKTGTPDEDVKEVAITGLHLCGSGCKVFLGVAG